jgi:hypothetical protein
MSKFQCALASRGLKCGVGLLRAGSLKVLALVDGFDWAQAGGTVHIEKENSEHENE